MQIKDQIYGLPISEELSESLKKHTNNRDWAEVSIKTRVGTSTLRDVSYRNRALTEKNSVGIIELIKQAKRNCAYEVRDAYQSIRLFDNVLIEEPKEKADEVK